MYTYTKIKVSSTDCPKRFYRVMYVRDDLTLYEMGICILQALRAEFEHMFLFRDKEFYYEDKSWIENDYWNTEPILKDYKKTYSKDLHLNSQNACILTYDTGDGWEFTIKFYKKTITREDDEAEMTPAFVTEAKGDRIWEDYRYTFHQFLNNNPDLEKVMTEEGRPWNIPDGPLSLFDAEIDLEELNDDITGELYF